LAWMSNSLANANILVTSFIEVSRTAQKATGQATAFPGLPINGTGPRTNDQREPPGCRPAQQLNPPEGGECSRHAYWLFARWSSDETTPGKRFHASFRFWTDFGATWITRRLIPFPRTGALHWFPAAVPTSLQHSAAAAGFQFIGVS
jgi:hypothetical protein